MTNAPPSRRTHVTRLVGTNDAGDVLQDIWVDLERFEIMRPATQTSDGSWQGMQRMLRWTDDPDANDFQPDGTPSRHLDFIKVCSPNEADVNNPTEYVKVPVIKTFKSGGVGQNYQDNQLNDDTVLSRKVTVRKIVHFDTNIDDAAQAAFDADPTRTAYVVKGVDYTRDDSTKDDGQFVDHEIIEFFKPNTNALDDAAGQVNRNVQVKLQNQYQIDQSDDPDGTVVGDNGINPPYRLDPWQNIINVKFKTLYLLVGVSASNQSFSFGPIPAPAITTPLQTSTINQDNVKLLDSVLPPGGNTSSSGFGGCFAYLSTGTLAASWAARPIVSFPSTNNACPWPGPGPQPSDILVGQVNFGKEVGITQLYLYRIPAGDGLVTVNVSGLMPQFDSGLDPATQTETRSFGGGQISVSVYSTVHGTVKKIHQLITSDSTVRPDPDDTRLLTLTSDNQGKFEVNVKLDKDPAHAQIDNYGKKFQPFKVTLTPASTSTDSIPSQPPTRLPGPVSPP